MSEVATKRRAYILCAIITMTITGVYALISSLSSMPYAEGWNSYYALCMNNGEQIYSDFNYLFWPLYQQIITFITSFAGYDLFILRCLGAVIFALIAFVSYFICTKIVSPKYAMIAAITGTFYVQSEAVQVFYDYVRFMDLFAYCSTFFLLCYSVYAIKSKTDDKKSIKLMIVYSLLAGLFTGLFICTKQNMGFIYAAFGICLMLFLCFIRYRKAALASVGLYIGATSITVFGLLFMSLGIEGWGNFIERTIGSASSAKGGIATILFNWIKSGIPTFSQQVPLILFVFVILLINLFFNSKKMSDGFYQSRIITRISTFWRSVFSDIKLSICEAKWFVNAPIIHTKGFKSFFVFLGRCFLLFLRGLPLIVSAAILFVVIYGYYNESFARLFLEQQQLSAYAIYLFMVTIFAFNAIKLTYMRIRKKSSEVSSSSIVLMVLGGAVFAIGYGCGTSGGLSQGELGLGLGISISILFFYMKSKIIGSICKIGLLCIAFLLSASSLTLKYANPYNWWGMSQPSIWQCTYETDIELFKHIKMSEDTGKNYESIVHEIINNTSPDDKIFCFPHIPVFYLATNRMDPGTYSKVQWFDVCSDDVIMQDINILRENPPKAFVVYNVPDWVQSSHEALFRSGDKAAVREMYDFITDYCMQNGYTNCGTYQVNSDNSLSLYIKENTESVSFFTNKGTGKSNDPYIISNREQLIAFSNTINKGWSFKNYYVSLDNDIDLSGMEWIPIGATRDSTHFAGVFNGNGHIIKNISITKAENEFSGLFGFLEGAVVNLGMVGGSIKGETVGVIAASSLSIDNASPEIFNCYTDVPIEGSICGSIAGAFSGQVHNCFSMGNAISKRHANIANDSGGLSMYNCYVLEGSFSSHGLDELSQTSANNYSVRPEIMLSQAFADILNLTTLQESQREFDIYLFTYSQKDRVSFDKWVGFGIDKSALYSTGSDNTSESNDNTSFVTVAPDCIQYGPYTRLNPGNYQVTFEGYGLENASFDFFSQGLGEIQPTVKLLSQNDSSAQISFSLDSNVTDAEFRTFNNGEEYIGVKSISVKYLKTDK